MATKLYFHTALSTVGGTLPSSTQSGLTLAGTGGDAQTVNRSMSCQIGKSQTTATKTSAATTSATNYYFTKFVSPPLKSNVTISAQTWTFSFAGKEANAAANWPTTTTGALPEVVCYVWRPSTGAKVGNILIGASSTGFVEAGTSNTAISGNFTGSSVVSLAGDVIVFELVFQTTQGGSTARLLTFNYDGTTEASTTSCASFLSAGTDSLNFLNSYALADTVSITDSVGRTFQRSITEALGSMPATLTGFVGRVMSDALVAVKTGGGNKFTRSIAESISVSDSLKKKAIKKISESLTLTDALKKEAIHKLTDTLSISDVLKKKALHKIAESLSLSDALKKLALHKLADTLSVSETLAKIKKQFRTLSDSLTISDALKKKALHGISEILGTITDIPVKKKAIHGISEAALSITDSIKRKIGRKLTDTITVSDALAKLRRVPKALADTVTVSDSLKKLAHHFIADSISATDSLKKKAIHFLTDALGAITDSISASKTSGLITRTISETVTLTDALRKKAIHKISESAGTISDSLVKRASHFLADVIGAISETLSKAARHRIAEAITVSDSLGKEAIHKRAFTESIGAITDSLAKIKKQFRTIVDTLTISADALRKKAIHKIADVLGISETLARTSRFRRSISESVGSATELLKKRASHLVSESIGVAETLVKKASLRIIDTAISITDALVNKKGKFIKLVEPSISLSETLNWVFSTQHILDVVHKLVVKVIGEPVDFGEVFDETFIHQPKLIHEPPISISDSLRGALTASFSEIVSVVDSLKKFASLHLATEAVPFSELTVKVKRANRSPTDSLTISDSIRKKASKTITELVSITELLRKGSDKRAFLETLTFLPDILRKMKIPKPFSDVLTESDALKKKAIKTISAPIMSQDALVKKALHKLADVLSITDFLARSRIQFRSIVDSVSVSDILRRTKVARLLREIVNVSEIIIAAANKGKHLSDSLTIVETFVKHHRFRSFISDLVTAPSDIISKVHRYIVKVVDIVGVPGFGAGRGGTRNIAGPRRPFMQSNSNANVG